jgi:hypothetical protein
VELALILDDELRTPFAVRVLLELIDEDTLVADTTVPVPVNVLAVDIELAKLNVSNGVSVAFALILDAADPVGDACTVLDPLIADPVIN